MKNIHLLKTDKPSRLLKDIVDETYQFKKVELYGNRFELPLNIYITSNSEDINENDYIITKDNRLVHVSYLMSKDLEDASKVVLTDNQDLIKDGVQSIEDDFLEWFVKNPSCEYVKVIDKMRIFNVDELRERHRKGLPHLYSEKIAYKIIIPKEEPKQETLGYICPTTKKQCDDECCVSAEDCHIEAGIDVISEPKQETLESIANEYSERHQDVSGNLGKYLVRTVFIDGYQTAKEQMYSEEEFKEMVYHMVGALAHANNMTFNGAILDELFNKFKK